MPGTRGRGQVDPQTPTRAPPQARPSRTRRAAPPPPDRTPTPPPTPPQPQPRNRRRRQPQEPPTEPAPTVGENTGEAATGDNDVFTSTPAGHQRRANVRFNEPQSEGEFFPSPSPTTSRRNPPSPNRHRGSPRAGPHAPPSRAHPRPAGSRSGAAKDIWTFIEGETEDSRECILCRQAHQANPHQHKQKFYSGTTSTGVLRKHLYTEHLDVWVESCDQLQILIKAKEAKPYIEDYRQRKAQQPPGAPPTSQPQEKRPEFSQEAFVDAIVEFIVSDDQSLNVIENTQLRAIFLMLREELRDSDIPHRTTIRKRVLEVWDEHLKNLEHEMADALGKISTTMDMWSDQQKVPYMAVTAHWIQAQLVTTSESGPQSKLTLRSDLIGFIRVPGHHDGDHLAAAFLHVVDRIRITHKLGWVTLDNASNNDTFMAAVERELTRRRIPFCKVKRRIRCFPHIVNLACKAILAGLTNMDFAAAGARDFVRPPGAAGSFLDAVNRDPVATIRTVVRSIRASSLRRQYFSEILKALQHKDLQLLRDVDTRWSSTLLMIDRAILLREAIDEFLQHDEFKELHKYQLGDRDWAALESFRRILAVPHAFQQKLSAEKTPTLGRALPAFEAMIKMWQKQQEKYPETRNIVQKGINKLGAYQERVEGVPVYVCAMILNPATKLSWFEKHRPDRVQWAKDLFLVELNQYRTSIINTPARPSHSNWADEILGLDSPERPQQSRSVREEFQAYLGEGLYEVDSSVDYWQKNQSRYPTLFKFALDVLPIQGSAVPCERVFSSSAETDTKRRNGIAPELMEALQMLKYSIKRGRGLDFTQGTTREDELAVLEAVMAEHTAVPEDKTGFNAFIQSLLAQRDSESDS